MSRKILYSILNKILFIDLQNLGKIIYLYALLQKNGTS